MNYLPLPG